MKCLKRISMIASIFIILLASISLAGPMSNTNEKTITIQKVHGSNILSNLAARMKDDTSGKELPVIITYKKMNQMQNVKHSLNTVAQFSPTHIYKTIPAVAAKLTKKQITQLSKSPDVAQIEYDETVKAYMESANYWYGTKSARSDFSVDGNHDGSLTSYTKKDIVVAIIDTGIDGSHVDLDGGKIIGWNDMVNKKSDPYDDQGHGTHVASIVAGSGDGNSKYKGVAPGASLVGVKVLDKNGSGSMSNVIAGIDWVVSNKDTYGIRVINMSLGTPFSSDGTDATSKAVNRAVEAGIVTCVAAGNSGPATRTVGAPGAAEKALTVGATADPGEGGFNLAYFSSRGPTADDRVKPDIASPGFNITAAEANTTDGYVAHSGTSMATPFMAGTVALILDANPDLTPGEVYNIVTSTARDFGKEGKDNDYGFGHLNAYAAIKKSGNFQISGAPPQLPNHLFGEGSIRSDQGEEKWTFNVTSTESPIGISLIMTDWWGFWFLDNMDYNIYLYDSNGQEVAKSEKRNSRQETIGFTPTKKGTYTLKVKSEYGTGKYFFDVSAFGENLRKK